MKKDEQALLIGVALGAAARLSDVYWDFFDGFAYMQAPVDCPSCGKPSKYSARRLPQNYIDHHDLRGSETNADRLCRAARGDSHG